MTPIQTVLYYLGFATAIALIVLATSQFFTKSSEFSSGPAGIVTIKLGGAQGISTCSEVLPYYKENGRGVVKLGGEYPPIELPWGGTRYQRFVKEFTFEI